MRTTPSVCVEGKGVVINPRPPVNPPLDLWICSPEKQMTFMDLPT